jgi:hypothetical protein
LIAIYKNWINFIRKFKRHLANCYGVQDADSYLKFWLAI